MATFAVFGDVHGRITLMLVMARRWEVESGRTLDGILQVGDMGAFPDPGRLDRATARHAQHDRDELGFSEYLQGCEEGAALLGGPGWPVIWMRGNHEDFDYLARFREAQPVDPWGRLVFVPDGQSTTVAGITVGAMGGRPSRASEVERGRGEAARARFRKAKNAPPDPCDIPRRVAQTAFAEGGLDVLLSHAGPSEALAGGSDLLDGLARRVRPQVHLFGHHHVTIGPVPGPGGAVVVGLDHLEFVSGQGGRLQSGCWGILDVFPRSSPEGGAVTWTWGDRFRWVSQLNRSDYRAWIPGLTAG